LAVLAEQQTREQSVLWCPSRACLSAATGTELGIDFLPYRRFDDRRMLTRVHRTVVFHHAGINRVGEQAV
jgi:hypothetical protein